MLDPNSGRPALRQLLPLKLIQQLLTILTGEKSERDNDRAKNEKSFISAFPRHSTYKHGCTQRAPYEQVLRLAEPIGTNWTIYKTEIHHSLFLLLSPSIYLSLS